MDTYIDDIRDYVREIYRRIRVEFRIEVGAN
jgi:hypothetical protein